LCEMRRASGRQAHGNDAPATIETQACVELRPCQLAGRRHGGEATLRLSDANTGRGSGNYLPDPESLVPR
jgi:hypothetical protein